MIVGRSIEKINIKCCFPIYFDPFGKKGGNFLFHAAVGKPVFLWIFHVPCSFIYSFSIFFFSKLVTQVSGRVVRWCWVTSSAGASYNFDYSRARAYCACSRCGWGVFGIFTLVYPFSCASPSLWGTARYKLKYCLKGPLNPKQPTNQLLNYSRKTFRIWYAENNMLLYCGIDTQDLWLLFILERDTHGLRLNCICNDLQ